MNSRWVFDKLEQLPKPVICRLTGLRSAAALRLRLAATSFSVRKPRSRACLKIAPLAQAEIKRLLRQGAEAPIESAKSYEQEVLFRLYSTANAQEGIDAFLKKREPQFKGA